MSSIAAKKLLMVVAGSTCVDWTDGMRVYIRVEI